MRGRFTAVTEGKGVKRQGEEKGEGGMSELEQEGKRKWKGREKREDEKTGERQERQWGMEREERKRKEELPCLAIALQNPRFASGLVEWVIIQRGGCWTRGDCIELESTVLWRWLKPFQSSGRRHVVCWIRLGRGTMILAFHSVLC